MGSCHICRITKVALSINAFIYNKKQFIHKFFIHNKYFVIC
jgi:hypothetical protein